MSSSPVGPVPTPPAVANCQPNVRKATATEFELVNPLKQSNFIVGELVRGLLSFLVENLPKDGSGCPGTWMFDQIMLHFGSSVTGIQGTWVAPGSDNLAELNRLTASGVPIEHASRQTWTGKRASDWLFTQVHVIAAVGSPGSYSRVLALFDK